MRYRLRQVQIVHRHGDRTPLWNVFAGHKMEEQREAKRWLTKLPSDAVLSDLCGKYVLASQTPQSVPNRLPSSEFGRLTSIGMEQMIERGVQLRQNLDPQDVEGTFFSQLDPENVMVFANSHERTQLSVKALLLGLLHAEKKLFPLQINLLPIDQDFLNRYSFYSQLVAMKATMETTDFELRFREAEMKPIKEQLCGVLPIFSQMKHKFVWMIAADYYTCRISHKLSLLSGIEDCHRETMEHLSFRFQRFYSDPKILYLVAGGIMEQIYAYVLQTINHSIDSSARLIAYSGHDVTLLAILHFLGAAMVGDKSWWPDYGTAITFQLLEREDGKWFVRVEMDGILLQLKNGSLAFVPAETFCSMINDRMASIKLRAEIKDQLYSK